MNAAGLRQTMEVKINNYNAINIKDYNSFNYETYKIMFNVVLRIKCSSSAIPG